MTQAPGSPKAACRFTGLRRDLDGTAAIEFAIVLPVMLTLWAGTVELGHAIDNWRKATSLARAVADLTSQGDTQNPIASSTMNDILASSQAIMRPFGTANTTVVVSAVSVKFTTSLVHPIVCSSVATSNATARQTGLASDLPIPAGFLIDGERYILAEIRMPYAPIFGASLVRLINGIGTINLGVSMPWPTRGGQAYGSTYTEVILPGGSQCP